MRDFQTQSTSPRNHKTFFVCVRCVSVSGGLLCVYVCVCACVYLCVFSSVPRITRLFGYGCVWGGGFVARLTMPRDLRERQALESHFVVLPEQINKINSQTTKWVCFNKRREPLRTDEACMVTETPVRVRRNLHGSNSGFSAQCLGGKLI